MGSENVFILEIGLFERLQWPEALSRGFSPKIAQNKVLESV